MDLNSRTVKQLQELLRKEGLPISGTKKVLIERLQNPENLQKKTEKKKKDVYYETLSNNTDLRPAANNMFVRKDLSDKYFINPKKEEWEKLYKEGLTLKYQKNTKKINTELLPKRRWEKDPPIYLIPRERGGTSYKEVELKGAVPEDIYFAAISKGFTLQNVSSFSLGPLPGEGLCLVNSAFSKSIYKYHLEGGQVNLKRKTFWQKKKERTIEVINKETMKVNDKIVNIIEWLESNKDLWYNEWELWRRNIALCSEGNFHWGGEDETIIYFNGKDYLDFVTWKKQCYILPSYKLMEEDFVFNFLKNLRKQGIALGLVHPKAKDGLETPITIEFLNNLFNSKDDMCCQPYVVAAKLLEI